jgi:transcriptional regulator with XRE-family HTH domain
VSNPASLNAAQSVKRAPRAWIILGLVALVLEGAFAILSLAVVAVITSAILTRQAAISVRALFLPRLGRSHWKPSLMATMFPNPIDKHVGSRVRMRRMMLGMSQTNLADAFGLTFQQVQKYEKGTNRISASRLQQTAHVLQVPVEFFFEGAPSVPGAPRTKGTLPMPDYAADFLATSDGLALTKAFIKIKNKNLRRRIVDLVEGIADQ